MFGNSVFDWWLNQHNYFVSFYLQYAVFVIATNGPHKIGQSRTTLIEAAPKLANIGRTCSNSYKIGTWLKSDQTKIGRTRGKLVEVHQQPKSPNSGDFGLFWAMLAIVWVNSPNLGTKFVRV